MNTNLKFDLVTVLDDNILEAIAKKSGWNDDTRLEEWILWVTKQNIYINIELITTEDNKHIKSIHKTNKDNIDFYIPLIMCRDEFLTKIMKLCGYDEDRYNKENVIKYIIDCQRSYKGDEFQKLYISIPKYS